MLISRLQVARDAAQGFNPNIKLVAYHANIKESQFNIDWFSSFNLVFNALDNLDARRHVNKMCLAADVPLIESGTTGFKGQSQVIKKGMTECYDCNPKEVPKSFPVCTIRSTPSQPIHCIVWAKIYLLPELFGVSEDDSPELDASEDAENREEIQHLRREAKALKDIRDSVGSDDFPKKIFDKVFKEDIERLRSMEEMWRTRKQPRVLEYDNLQQEATAVDGLISMSDQKAWTLIEAFSVFKDSLRRLSIRMRDERMANKSEKAIITFDKDDADTLDFVTASANLRSSVFGIEAKSKFDVKQMAGNIIPAIATTNAVTAGLCVMQAFKVLKGEYFKAKMLFLERGTARALNSELLRPPNPECAVCGVVTSRLEIDPKRATLNDLVQDILKIELNYGEEMTINNEVGTVYDPDLEDNLEKKLEDLGIKADSFLTVIDDEEENPRVNLQLALSAKSFPEDSKPVVLSTKPEIARRPRRVAMSETNGGINGVGAPNSSKPPGKNKRAADEAGLDEETPQKKVQSQVKAATSDGDSTIVLNDEAEGAIVIND